ncbi:MAG: DegT/DnrJ/EryC1/StrS family aminotransferase [Candidatus Omnitrophica bacterium]|nr:DegT/DnrJ/EryC1/StrS family aminotransferase [Candidatus Omnitrophota bacterium]
MIPVAKPYLTDDEVKAAQEVILSGWVTQGPKVAEFENAFKQFVGAEYACATSNCTTALHLALKVCGVSPGDVVITVSHSFIATANVVRQCLAEPVFIDIDPNTYNMCPRRLEKFLQEECETQPDGLYFKNIHELSCEETPLHYIEQRQGRISAILAVHQMGMPCNLNQILPLAKKYNLPVVEDAACAIGSEIFFDNRIMFEKIGRPHGDVVCFSFHPRKVITTGEGGMITTNNAEYDRKFRLLRHQGMDVSDIARHESKTVQFEQYTTTAYNYRMTDIQAAIGLEQLKKLPKIIEQRRKIVEMYRRKLSDVDYFRLIEEPAYCKTNWQSFPIRVLDSSPRSRDEIMQYLMDHDIATRRGIMNIHQEQPYLNKIWQLPESEAARDQTIILPVYHTLSEKAVDLIVEQLKMAISQVNHG